jgi:hypothetical protein
MARDISTINQINLWGKQADAGTGFNPQRIDLWMVDFKMAVDGVSKAANIPIDPILPQYLRSISLPEVRTKAEPIRRDSVPFQMPSWDDPLDAIKITFLMDTHQQDDVCNVVQFLDAWLALTRAGRGNRVLGYNMDNVSLLLNNNFSIDFRFDVSLSLLRGVEPTNISNLTNQQSDAFKAQMANANTNFNNLKAQQGQIQQGPTAVSDVPTSEFALSASLQRGANSNMSRAIYRLYSTWLGAYKISDLSYAQSDVVTVEATFYSEAVYLTPLPRFTPV